MGTSKLRDDGGDVTKLLGRVRRGEHDAEEELIELVYDELRGIAARYMRRERTDHSLQPTALVHEAYLRLIGQQSKSWKNRAHFFAIAALLMRQILVDHARRHDAVKRGDGQRPVSLDSSIARRSPRAAIDPDESADLIALDNALTELATASPRQAKIIQMRFFAGMSRKEMAEATAISERTVDRELAAAQAWLTKRLRPSD